MKNKKVIAFLLAAAMLTLFSTMALAVTNYTVTYDSKPANGAVSVIRDADGSAVSSGDSLAKGTKIKVTATPDAGYFLRSLQNGKTGISSNKVFAIASNLDITAVFDNQPLLAYGKTDGVFTGGSLLVVDSDGNEYLSGDHLEYGKVYTLRTQTAIGYELTGISSKGVINLLQDNTFKVADNAHDVSFSASFKRTDKKTDDEDDDSDTTKTDAAKPYVIISGYKYGDTLVAGQTCELTMTFLNTSKTIAVENMKATMSMPEALMLTSSSNSFYIEKLAAGGSITKTVQVTAKPTAEPQSHEISVDFNYDYIDNKVRKSNETAEKISIPVIQIDRFEVTGVDVESQIIVGEESTVTVNFVNKGRSDVYNISAEIAGNIQNPGQQQNLGNLTPGSTSSADFYIIAPEGGSVTGEVTITYEDTNMQQQTKTIAYSTEAMSYEEPAYDPGMGMDDPGMMDPGMEQKSGLAWYWYAVGAAVLGGGAFLFLRRRKIKKLMESDDADI